MADSLPESILEKLYDLSFTAGMNQRYHQIEWTWNESFDMWVRIIVGVLTIIGLVYSVFDYVRGEDRAWGIGWIIERFTGYKLTNNDTSLGIAVLSVLAATVLNVMPTSSDVVYHSDLFRRWSELRRDVDDLSLVANSGLPTKDAATILAKLEELESRKNSINALERAPDNSLLEKCFTLEETARVGKEDSEKHIRELQKKVAMVPSKK